MGGTLARKAREAADQLRQAMQVHGIAGFEQAGEEANGLFFVTVPGQTDLFGAERNRLRDQAP
jgi:hypothetical protein